LGTELKASTFKYLNSSIRDSVGAKLHATRDQFKTDKNLSTLQNMAN
jgi:hypothetical protein